MSWILPKPQICAFITYGMSFGLISSRFTVYKDADLFDFINAPVGKGLPIQEQLRPLIASTDTFLNLVPPC